MSLTKVRLIKILFLIVLSTALGLASARYLYAKDVQAISIDGIDFDFVLIPASQFEMGSTDGEKNETPIHSVSLLAFNMMNTEVTQGQWLAIMGNMPHGLGLTSNAVGVMKSMVQRYAIPNYLKSMKA